MGVDEFSVSEAPGVPGREEGLPPQGDGEASLGPADRGGPCKTSPGVLEGSSLQLGSEPECRNKLIFFMAGTKTIYIL